MRDEKDLLEMLEQNPSLRKRNPGLYERITGNTCNTRSTHSVVVQLSEKELHDKAEAMLESELQSELRRIALAAGFLYYHTHNSRRSDPGFPDTVLLRLRLRTAELYFVECKRQAEEPTDEQAKWIANLQSFAERLAACVWIFFLVTKTVIVVDVFIWRPMDLLSGTIVHVLTDDSGVS